MLLNYTVPPSDEGMTLGSVLRNRLRLSATLLRRLKAASSLYVNGQPRYTDYRVCAGDEVSALISEPGADFPPQEAPLSVIYEDEWLLAVDKPSGVITHPTHSRFRDTLANHALYHILSGGGEACHAVNRLDRDTGGIVLFAKSGYVKNLMSGAVLEKDYTAAVCGAPVPSSGSIELPIRRSSGDSMLRIAAPDGAYARTDYATTATNGQISLLRLRLHTGRTHQIRVHCFSCGFPLLGDRLYCTAASRSMSEKLDITSQLLHAGRIKFLHPITGEPITLEVFPPWEKSIAKLIEKHIDI